MCSAEQALGSPLEASSFGANGLLFEAVPPPLVGALVAYALFLYLRWGGGALAHCWGNVLRLNFFFPRLCLSSLPTPSSSIQGGVGVHWRIATMHWNCIALKALHFFFPCWGLSSSPTPSSSTLGVNNNGIP